MSTSLKYILVIAHLIGAGIITYALVTGEGDSASGFAAIWTFVGSLLLVAISISEGDTFGVSAGIVMLGLSIVETMSGNTELFFVITTTGALLLGLEMYTTGKRPGDNRGEMLVIYLMAASICISSAAAAL